MNNRYNRISPAFWTDRTVMSWDDDTKLLALYLMTCEHRITEGLFRLPKAYVCADLGWSDTRLHTPWETLCRDGFIMYDETVHVVLLTKALKWNPTNNDSHAKGAIKKLEEVPETPLLWEFMKCAKRYDTRLYTQCVTRWGRPQALTQALTQAHIATRACAREAGGDGDDQEAPDSVPKKDAASERAKEIDPVYDDGVTPERFYEQAVGIVGPMIVDLFGQYEARGLQQSAIKWAVREYAAGNGRTVSYLRSILERLSRQKLATAEKAEAAQEGSKGARDSPSVSDITESIAQKLMREEAEQGDGATSATNIQPPVRGVSV